MRNKIPAPVISIIADYLPDLESHASLDNLFMYADAPGDPPDGSKPAKTQAWLRITNRDSDNPLVVLGKLIEAYMELPATTPANPYEESKFEFREKLEATLQQCGLTYINGATVSAGGSVTSKTLAEIIKGRDIPAIEAEFLRATSKVESEPREAVSAACNILESLFKTYISDEGLEMPQKQDLQNVWKVVRADLGFDASLVQDNDLKKILSGVLSVVDGIGAFRTHASSAHGQGRKVYNIKPRHARLAVNSAHSLAMFILETWDERAGK